MRDTNRKRFRLGSIEHEMAFHGAMRRIERAARNIIVRLARLNDRLFSDDTFAVNMVETAMPVTDPPVPGQQLNRGIAVIFNPDMISPEPAQTVNIRLLRQKCDRNPNGDAFGSFGIGEKRIHALTIASKTDGRKSLIKVIDQILRIFQSDIDPHHVFGNSDLEPGFLGETIMCGRSRVAHERATVPDIV